ncbi:MAG: Alginate lyase [Proteobacteria bacterium]|nr:Alginate lyase [Pseudomonadota bacterium]
MKQPDLLPLFASDQLAALRAVAAGEGLMARSMAALKAGFDPWLSRPIEVPGHGEAGSDQHNRHQLNYQLIDSAGLLYQLSSDEKYSRWVCEIVVRYADVYLQMGFQPKRNTNPPGRIFHQILNESMWLLYVACGYGCVRHTLDEAQRSYVEARLFRPMLEMFTETYAHDFDHIHNHGLWAVAAVGLCGLVIEAPDYVAMAVDGLAGDRQQGGFLAQISQLFSPSGYYIEGPYYHRFAIRPLCLFAEALHHHRPDLDIYNYKGQVIRTTIRALLATAYPDGRFPALNDASQSMSIRDEGVVIALAVHCARYGSDEQLLSVAHRQGRVWVHPAGLAVARAADASAGLSPVCWPSVELSEGPDGTCGAQGFLRACNAEGDVTQVVMNYGQHGMGHGHFDTLGITWYNHGAEVLKDYGYGRWVNVETKFGGRYLNENKSYARQTVAHNCVVVDQQTQNGFDVQRADRVHGQRHFFVGSGAVQAMSARADEHYPGVRMQRSLLLLQLPQLGNPLLVDLFRLCSDTRHQYDYALQYAGQISDTNLQVIGNARQWNVLGDAAGYQHLFGVARAELSDGLRVTWLQGARFNTWAAAASEGELLFTQTGATDPDFNLRRESGFLLRTQASSHLFASAFETHGFFNEETERCQGARGSLQAVRVLGHDAVGSVLQIVLAQQVLTLMVSNRPDVTATTDNETLFGDTRYAWRGYFACEQG